MGTFERLGFARASWTRCLLGRSGLNHWYNAAVTRGTINKWEHPLHKVSERTDDSARIPDSFCEPAALLELLLQASSNPSPTHPGTKAGFPSCVPSPSSLCCS